MASRLRFLTLMPALQTRTSIDSNAAVTSSTAALTEGRSAISQVTTRAESWLDGTLHANPGGDLRLEDGDLVIAIGTESQLIATAAMIK